MQLNIQRDTFLDGLSRVAPITNQRTTLPILNNVLIDAGATTLTLMATNLEVGIRTEVEAEVQEPGRTTIPGHRLYQIVRELPSQSVTVESGENHRLNLSCGNSNFTLAGMDPADYPDVAIPDVPESTSIEASVLVDALDSVVFAAAHGESRFNLAAVLFEPAEDKTRLVTTDGHRLASTVIPLTLHGDNRVVPRRGIEELRKAVGSVSGDIRLGFTDDNLVVTTGGLTMSVRLIDATYPEWRNVVPDDEPALVTANLEALMRCLKRVTLLTSDLNKGATVQIEGGTMTLTATHPDLGTATDSVEVEHEGEPIEVVLNAAYLLDALSVLESETVRLEYRPDGKPIIIRPSDGEYFSLVMPMRK